MVYNPYIVVPLATWAVAQVAKFAIAAMRGNIDFRYLFASGGMPSVHSAVVSSLATTALLAGGADSPVFGLAVIFAVIVMYDSLGVRRSVGEQAAVLNRLIDNLDRNRFRMDGPAPQRLREVLGHSPREVFVGAVLGIVLAGLFNYDKLGGLTQFLTAIPVKYELWAYAAIFAILIIGGIIARIVLGRRYRKSAVMKHFRSRLLVWSQTIGWLGVISVALVYERASYLAWRLWPVLILVIGVLWGAWIFTSPSTKGLSAGLAAEATQKRKMRWFGRKSK